MKLEKFDYTVWGVLAGLSLALSVVIFAGDQVGARVLRTFPNDGGQIGDDGRIGIEFAQPMQVRTVEPLLSIDPPTVGRIEWDGQREWFVPDRPLLPGVRYTARLRAGGLSQGGLQMKREATWHFTAREVRIVYLALEKSGRTLWRIRKSGGSPEQLAGQTGDIYDFAVSPDGQQIVYSLANSQKGVDLWMMSGSGQSQQRLVDCGPDNCGSPAWSPDGKVIAYSRAPAGIQPGQPSGASRVWIITLANSQTMPLNADPQVLGVKVSWSPDSRRLAFYDQSASGLRILDLTTREEIIQHTLGGSLPTWSPDSNQILFNSLTLSHGQAVSSLALLDLVTHAQTMISVDGQESAILSAPAWSPTGEWVLVGIKRSAGDSNSQLELMLPTGQNSRLITTDATYSQCCFQWDPWGQAIVFQRTKIGQLSGATPELMIWSLAAGQVQQLVNNGFAPAWQP